MGKPQPSIPGLVAAGAVTTGAQRESVLSKFHSKANRDGCTPVEKQQALVKGHNQPEVTSQQEPRAKFPDFSPSFDLPPGFSTGLPNQK